MSQSAKKAGLIEIMHEEQSNMEIQAKVDPSRAKKPTQRSGNCRLGFTER